MSTLFSVENGKSIIDNQKNMLPILPREFLWTNLETMDEFFEMEPVNEFFFDAYQVLRENPFMVKPDAVKVFNEVFYQTTRAAYEHPIPSDIPRYFADVKANLGWNYSAELVFTMVYFILKLNNSESKSINNFFINAIMIRNMSCPYWRTFDDLFKKLENDKKYVAYSFKPHPIAVEYLTAVGYVNWMEITKHFDLSCVDHVINLWDSQKDKRCVAKMILDSGQSQVLNGSGNRDADQLSRYLQQYIKDDAKKKNTTNSAEWLDYKLEVLSLRTSFLEKENALLSRMKMLQAENNSLKTLLEEKKKAVGKNRKFTLVQIVDYCKGCVAWDDSKSIVAMLNKMLRIDGTQEDSDLVDSIETEFKNRLHGNTTIQGDYYEGDKVHEKNVIPNVGNYKPQINTQTLGLPTPSAIGKQDPNLLKDE